MHFIGIMCLKCTESYCLTCIIYVVQNYIDLCNVEKKIEVFRFITFEYNNVELQGTPDVPRYWTYERFAKLPSKLAWCTTEKGDCNAGSVQLQYCLL